MNASNTSTEKPLAYRVREFCQRVGISPATFYKYVNLGKIRVVKIGGRTLVPASEAERLLDVTAATTLRQNPSRP